MGTGKFNAGGNLVMNYRPMKGEGGGGGRNTPSCFTPQKSEISVDLMDHLGCLQTYMYPFPSTTLQSDYLKNRGFLHCKIR